MQKMPETRVQSLVQKDPLEEEMATHSSILAWKHPWTEEPGGLQSMGSQRVGPNWATKHIHNIIHSVLPHSWHLFMSVHRALYSMLCNGCKVISMYRHVHLIYRVPLSKYFAAAAAAKSLQSCPTLRPHRQQPTTLPRPWDSPGKNTGVGCHFLLQYMKVKSESEVAQSYLTLSDPMDCSLLGSSVHGIFQARVLEWGAITHFQFLTTTNNTAVNFFVYLIKNIFRICCLKCQIIFRSKHLSYSW